MTFHHYWTEDGKEHINSLQEMAGVPFANHRIDKVADDERDRRAVRPFNRPYEAVMLVGNVGRCQR